MKACLLALIWLTAAAASIARAEPVADFYRGKQLTLLIRAAPGGNYDTYMRLLGRHLPRHLPGNPTAIPQNMPGAGGLVALNYMANVAPQDGTVLIMLSASSPMDQALGLTPELKADIRKLNWIGNISAENLFIVTGPHSDKRTVADAKQRVTALAGSGAGGTEVILTAILNNGLGTKFKNIPGYRSGPEMTLAMDRGETDGRWTTNLRALFASSKSRSAEGIAEGYNVLLQTGIEKDRQFQSPPLARELPADPKHKGAIEFISQVVPLARPVAVAQNVPQERVAALRKAFMATMEDPQFIEEAKRLDLEISPMEGSTLQTVVQKIVDAPPEVLRQIRDVVLQHNPSGVGGGP